MPNNDYERWMNDNTGFANRHFVMESLDNVSDSGDGYPGVQRCIMNTHKSIHGSFVLSGCEVSGSGLTAGYVVVNSQVFSMAALGSISGVASSGQCLVVNSSGEYAGVAPASATTNACPVAYNDSGTCYTIGKRRLSDKTRWFKEDFEVTNGSLTLKDTSGIGYDLITLEKGSGVFGDITLGGSSAGLTLSGDPTTPAITFGADLDLKKSSDTLLLKDSLHFDTSGKTIHPDTTLDWDLGTSAKRFGHAYANDATIGNDLTVTNNLTVDNIGSVKRLRATLAPAVDTDVVRREDVDIGNIPFGFATSASTCTTYSDGYFIPYAQLSGAEPAVSTMMVPDDILNVNSSLSVFVLGKGGSLSLNTAKVYRNTAHVGTVTWGNNAAESWQRILVYAPSGGWELSIDDNNPHYITVVLAAEGAGTGGFKGAFMRYRRC